MSSSTERPESLGQALDARDGSDGQQPERDPWFEPAVPPAAAEGESDSADGEAEADASQWFLPTGRAGLLPESMTDEPPEPGTGNLPRVKPSDSAPPWAAEPAETADGLPPPWESGPWGPDGTSRAGRADPQEQPASARPGLTEMSSPPAGVLAVRLPGGLRLGGRTSWVVAGALTAIAVVVVLIVAVGGGKSADPGCTAYKASGQKSYSAVLFDLKTGASDKLVAQLQAAIKPMNLAAARARQASLQTDLAGLTGDMQTAIDDINQIGSIPAPLQRAMRRDANAAAAACGS